MWEWQDEHGKWNPYNARTCLDLTSAADDDEIKVTACSRKYTINKGKLEQVNDDTGVKRNVRCNKTGSRNALIVLRAVAVT